MEEDDEEYYYSDYYKHEMTMEDGISCSLQVGTQVLKDIASLILYNMLSRSILLATQNIEVFQKIQMAPFINTIFGIPLLYAYFPEGFLLVLAFVFSSYIVFKILNHSKFLGFYMKTFCIFTLVTWESMTRNPTDWHKIRGIQMIAAMKLISLAFDQSTSEAESISIQHFMGYIFCPASLIYGPWMSFKDHTSFMKADNLKFTLRNIKRIVSASFIALICVLSMSCFLDILISDSYPKWIVAYRTALSFRSSHYFVSFMSQAILSGAGIDSIKITNPWSIEFPRSLSIVVINWNFPMHIWLKKYIFSKLKTMHPFIAIFATYLTSSLLHGLSLQIYAILFSLALYTFVEHRLRSKLSQRLNICIKSTPCKSNCSHRNSRITYILNLFFGLLALWHLTYLGLMFDFSNSQEEGYSISHTLEKWRSSNFISHWVVLATFLVTLFI